MEDAYKKAISDSGISSAWDEFHEEAWNYVNSEAWCKENSANHRF